MKAVFKIAVILLATVVAYALMGLFITAVQEWGFHGVSYEKSSPLALVLAGLGTFLSAVAGGWIAFRINGGRTKISNYLMCLLVVCETSWLISTGRADNPLWFDVLAALSLIVGILLGCNLSLLKKRAGQIPV